MFSHKKNALEAIRILNMQIVSYLFIYFVCVCVCVCVCAYKKFLKTNRFNIL